MSNLSGDAGEPSRPEVPLSYGGGPQDRWTEEIPWQIDPELGSGGHRTGSDRNDTNSRVGLGRADRADPLQHVMRETGDGSQMTDYLHIVEGLAADRYVLVLVSSKPTLISLSRADAIARGMTVLDADPAVLNELAWAGELVPLSLSPATPELDQSAGPPLRDLRQDDESQSPDSEIVQQLVAEGSVPVRPEPVEPVLAAPPTRVADAPVEIPVGHYSPEDAPPATKRRRSHSDDVAVTAEPSFPVQVSRSLHRSGHPDVVPVSEGLVPPEAQPATQRATVSGPVLRALDRDDEVAIPEFEVIDTAKRERLVPDVASLRDEQPLAVEVLPWQQPEFVPDWGSADQPNAGVPVATSIEHTARQPDPLAPVVALPVAEAPAVGLPPALRTEPIAEPPLPELRVSEPVVAAESDTAVPALSIVGLSRTFVGPVGPVPVLRDVSFDLSPGDLLVIVGPSGVGLTTLLHCASGLDRPDGGHVYVNGEEMGAWSEADRARFRAASAGFIAQTLELVDDLNARDNVALPLLAAGWSATPARREADRLLEQFNINQRAYFFPSQLSHSERVLTAVARALAGDPFIVWADDPTAGLDSTTGQMVIDALIAHHRRGATTVVASRDQRFLVDTARVVELRDGELR